ncbi:DUF3822 family protein [Cecembia sp.]|uniref:DUF3822 family protein n=1 Tax=Cecembia sp. TaxID=1898110 RepID=UPI0025C73BD0|nr:DUF3822 family protein [Cecembia sp.]
MKKIYCDKYDSEMVSYLSLFLYEEIRILLAKDINHKVVAVHTWNLLSSSEKPISKIWKDELYRLDVPTKVFVHNKYLALVPGALFNPEYLDIYLSFTDEFSAELKSFHTSLDSNNIQLVGGMDERLFQLLSDGKKQLSFHHGSSSFLSYCLAEKAKFLSQEILIYLFDKSFYLAAFDKETLKLFNRFEIENKENLLEYLFGLTEQLGFDRKYCRYNVFGNSYHFDFSEKWAQDYFKNINFESFKNIQNYHPGTESFANTVYLESNWEFS